MEAQKYKRVLIKISGEALAGDKHFGLNFDVIGPVCDVIKKCSEEGCEIGIVVGGGNFWRGVKDGGGKMERTRADHMGMLATTINALALQDALEQRGVEPIDMVVINLYPFRATIEKPGVTFDEAIENIDIGGPCMVRASAKNNKYVAIVTNPAKYGEIISILQKDGEFSDQYRLELAQEAFHHTAVYDTAIAAYLAEQVQKGAAK